MIFGSGQNFVRELAKENGLVVEEKKTGRFSR